MGKIPLERTIGDTYRFAFSNILSIFGIAWLPCVLMIAVCAGAVWWFLPDFAAIDWSAQPDVALNHEVSMRLWLKMLSVAPLLYFLFYLLFAMITVGIQRKALGLHPGPVFVYFSLGGEVWRLLGAMILAIIICCFNAACTVASVMAVFWLGEHFQLPSIYGLVETVAVIAGICWFYYSLCGSRFSLRPSWWRREGSGSCAPGISVMGISGVSL